METIQVSIAHAYPGTEFYQYAQENNLVQLNMADTAGHQLPNVVYPGILDRAEMVDWVERFYGEYYFRPKAAWRIVRKAIFDNNDRKRLYKEAKSLSESAPQAPEVCRGLQSRQAWTRPSRKRRTRSKNTLRFKAG